MTKAKATVGLAHGKDRRQNVYQAMDLVRSDLSAKVRERVLVKPNFLSSTNQLASSHPDALRGVLDFLISLPNRPSEVIVAEGANEKYSGEAFEKLGYRDVVNEYPFAIELVDLHQATEWVEKPVLMADGSQEIVRLPKLVLEHPCTISMAVAKTHDGCIVTLGLKNMIMGTMHKPDRIKMHGFMTHGERDLPIEVQHLNANLARIAKDLTPDITVIDGTRGLQGNGPGGDDGIDLYVAAASSDVHAADAVMAKAMGFDPTKLAQSYYGEMLSLGVSDLDHIKVVGADLAAVTKPFKPHETTPVQYQWAIEQMTEWVTA